MNSVSCVVDIDLNSVCSVIDTDSSFHHVSRWITADQQHERDGARHIQP